MSLKQIRNFSSKRRKERLWGPFFHNGRSEEYSMVGSALTCMVEWNALGMVRKKDSGKKVLSKRNITYGALKIEEKRSGSWQ